MALEINYKKKTKIHKHVEIKKHATQHIMSERRNQKKIKNYLRQVKMEVYKNI